MGSRQMANDEQVMQLIQALWKRSTNPIIDVRIQPRAETKLVFASTARYLVLESLRDPEHPDSKSSVLAPLWETKSYSAELLGESMPFWVVAFPHNHEEAHYSPREVVSRLLNKPECWPEGRLTMRWHIAAAT